VRIALDRLDYLDRFDCEKFARESKFVVLPVSHRPNQANRLEIHNTHEFNIL
jgi:hypothetical protein